MRSRNSERSRSDSRLMIRQIGRAIIGARSGAGEAL